MPRGSLDHVVESLLGEEHGGRYVDMRLDLVAEDTGEIVLSVGGRWDRAEKRYVGPARTRRVLRLHPGQLEAARWFARWIAARQRGEHLVEHGRPVFTLGLVGGRRGGKSVLGFWAVLVYAVAFPGAIGWIVVPIFPDVAEVEREVFEQVPRAWYGYRENEWRLVNGSVLRVVSSHDPQDLKRGRVDVVVMNEAQKQEQAAFIILRAAIADRGGLVLLTANPPDTARGEWVAELKEKADAGKIAARVFRLDPKLNPHVDRAALETLKDEVDERTYRREIEGEFLARTDVVMFGFSTTLNVRPRGTDADGRPLENVTRQFTERRLGYGCDHVHGMDFQGRPYMAAATLEMYRDPADPDGEPLVWAVDDFEVELATEDELVDALEAKGYTGAGAVVPDASGAYQDGARVKGHGSWDTLRKRGWVKLYYPIAGAKNNPLKTERLAIANGLLLAASGRRRLFVDPRCAYLIRALRLWEMRNGVPHWRSDYAHIVDALTYPLCRLFPRRAPRAPLEFTKVPRPERGGWETLR